MQAGTLSIKEIFQQERRYVVPLYQRPYVWGHDLQWAPFWEDVCSVAEKTSRSGDARPHFLGAVVLDMVRRLPGQMVTSMIIDGQQRLTTVQVFLEAFCDLLAVLGQEKHHKALLKLTRNDDPMSQDPDEVFKVWPTNIDQEHYRTVMQSDSPAELAQHYGGISGQSVGHNIADAYLFFYQSIKSWLGDLEADGFDSRLDALFNTVRENIRLVVIDLGHEDDAQLIFETLNARGTPLLPADLIKNDLFYLAKTEKLAMDKLYASYWKEYDSDAAYWRGLIGRGFGQRARIDLFFQYFLAARTKDDVSTSHLYGAFRDYRTNAGTMSAIDHLKKIKAYAKIYRQMDLRQGSVRQVEFLARVQDMEMLATYPFLLELFHHYKDHAWLNDVLIAVESFLVRRMICQLSARGYNRLFIDLLKTLDAPDDEIPVRIFDALKQSKGEAVRWPDDEEFSAAWVSVPAYKSLIRKRVLMVLQALEDHMRTEFSEVVDLRSKVTIEHILPQSWHEHWPLPQDQAPEVVALQRERLIHTFGNLTLVSGKLNPSISNNCWATKREAIEEHSVLRLNKNLHQREGWDEQAIELRTSELLDHVLSIWPGPQHVKFRTQELAVDVQA